MRLIAGCAVFQIQAPLNCFDLSLVATYWWSAQPVCATCLALTPRTREDLAQVALVLVTLKTSLMTLALARARDLRMMRTAPTLLICTTGGVVAPGAVTRPRRALLFKRSVGDPANEQALRALEQLRGEAESEFEEVNDSRFNRSDGIKVLPGELEAAFGEREIFRQGGATTECYLVEFNKPSWRELFGQVQRAVSARANWPSSISFFARAVWSSSKTCFGVSCLVKFKELFLHELFGQVQRVALARAIWSSLQSCFGESSLVEFNLSIFVRVICSKSINLFPRELCGIF